MGGHSKQTEEYVQRQRPGPASCFLGTGSALALLKQNKFERKEDTRSAKCDRQGCVPSNLLACSSLRIASFLLLF